MIIFLKRLLSYKLLYMCFKTFLILYTKIDFYFKIITQIGYNKKDYDYKFTKILYNLMCYKTKKRNVKKTFFQVLYVRKINMCA